MLSENKIRLTELYYAYLHTNQPTELLPVVMMMMVM